MLKENILFKPFDKDLADKCYNFYKEDRCRKPILTKAYNLYMEYERKGQLLIGKGPKIGQLAYFSNLVRHGMPPCGGYTTTRDRQIGLILSNNKMASELIKLGLAEKTKELRLKGLTANKYQLVSKIKQRIYDIGYVKQTISLGLLGDDNSYIDLTEKWGEDIVLDFSDVRYE